MVQVTTRRARVTVSADGAGVVSHAGSGLLADLADANALTGRLSAALGSLAASQTAHDPGRVLTDLAVAIADGAQCISDIAVLPTSPPCSGWWRRTRRLWRLLDRLDQRRLDGIASARAAARETAWAQRAETAGAAVPASFAAGHAVPRSVRRWVRRQRGCQRRESKRSPM